MGLRPHDITWIYIYKVTYMTNNGSCDIYIRDTGQDPKCTIDRSGNRTCDI